MDNTENNDLFLDLEDDTEDIPVVSTEDQENNDIDEPDQIKEDPAEFEQKFRDIEENVRKQVQSSVGSGSLSRNKQPKIEKTDTIRITMEELNRAVESGEGFRQSTRVEQQQSIFNNTDDRYTEDYEDEHDNKNRILIGLSILSAVFALLFVILLFRSVLKPITDNGELLRLEKQVEQLENKIKEHEDTISKDSETIKNLQDNLEQTQSQLADSQNKVEEQEKEIKDLKDTLNLKELELKEMQFRADMFQKYGPDWEK